MKPIHPQYVVDDSQEKKAVLLSYQEWLTILEALEELEDIQSYDLAKRDTEPSIPFEQAVREIDQGYKP